MQMPKERRHPIVALDWIMERPFAVVGLGRNGTPAVLEQLSDEEEAAVLALASRRG